MLQFSRKKNKNNFGGCKTLQIYFRVSWEVQMQKQTQNDEQTHHWWCKREIYFHQSCKALYAFLLSSHYVLADHAHGMGCVLGMFSLASFLTPVVLLHH